MTIEEMRVKLAVFCHDIENLEDPCENCPVNNIDNVCEDFNWQNAPERLVEKAYQAMKGEKTMNITADEIRKAALELIEKMAMSQRVTVGSKEAEMMRLNEIKTQAILGYINGVCALAKRVTGDEEAEADGGEAK